MNSNRHDDHHSSVAPFVELSWDSGPLCATDEDGIRTQLDNSAAVNTWLDLNRESTWVVAETGRVFWTLHELADERRRKLLRKTINDLRWVDVCILDGALRMARGEQEPPLRSVEAIAADYTLEAPNSSTEAGRQQQPQLSSLAQMLLQQVRSFGEQFLGTSYQVMGAVVAAVPGIAWSTPDEMRLKAERNGNWADLKARVAQDKALHSCFKWKGGESSAETERVRSIPGKLPSFLQGQAARIERVDGEPLPLTFVGGQQLSFQPADWLVERCCDPRLELWAQLQIADECRHYLRQCAGGPTSITWESWPRFRCEPNEEVVFNAIGAGWLRPVQSNNTVLVVELPDLEAAALMVTCRVERPSSDKGDAREAIYAAAFPSERTTMTEPAQRADVGGALAWLIANRLHPKHFPAAVGREPIRYALPETETAAAVARVCGAWPGLGTYYQHGLLSRLAQNLGVSAEQVQASLGRYDLQMVSDALTGVRRNEAIWAALVRLDQHGKLPSDAEPSQELYLRLAGSDVAAVTGRLRGKVLFGDATNPVVDVMDDFLKVLTFLMVTDSAGISPAAVARDSLLLVVPRGDELSALNQIRSYVAAAGAVVLQTSPIVQTRFVARD